MLTKGDDYPIHQTPEPIAYSGSDRNFYDRYFFNGYSPDGAVFFAAALGVYPHLNVMDAAFTVIVDGVQHAVHASKLLNMERLDMQVGPIRIEVVEPLEVLRVVCDDEANGIKGDVVFTRRCLPVEEPRFQFRNGPRMFMDYTRLTQNGSWTGSLDIQGKAIDVTSEWLGTRDRSWGVRPVGLGDPQPPVPAQPPQFYWLWAPLNFADFVSYYHINAKADGTPWNESAVLTPVGTDGFVDHARMAKASSKMHFKSGTRHAKHAEIFMSDEAGDDYHIDLTPQYNFQMAGLGYTHPEWGHGRYHGELAVGYETFDLASLNPNEMHHLHVQAFCTAALTLPDGSVRKGIGILEQLIMGAHAPSGFTDLFDVAP